MARSCAQRTPSSSARCMQGCRLEPGGRLCLGQGRAVSLHNGAERAMRKECGQQGCSQRASQALVPAAGQGRD